MTTEELEREIEAQVTFLLFCGTSLEDGTSILKKIALNYAEQFKYDFSKDCKCESRTGETWCCNQCGLPTTA